ncbi:unnamed protein product, partial [Ectocarpus sp. 8 AP-2014]
DLGRNQLQTLDGQALECCPALSTLILSQNLLREPPSPLCLPLLNELWLSGNQIRSMGSWASSPTETLLHLQDNALETLGGRFSLAGCPLLRSFDASFNQLRAPDEIALSLEACSGLEEVRLHDNPASACPNYADAIALSCP